MISVKFYTEVRRWLRYTTSKNILPKVSTPGAQTLQTDRQQMTDRRICDSKDPNVTQSCSGKNDRKMSQKLRSQNNHKRHFLVVCRCRTTDLEVTMGYITIRWSVSLLLFANMRKIALITSDWKSQNPSNLRRNWSEQCIMVHCRPVA